MTIQTERLTIRPVEATDAAFLLELLNDPDFLHYIGDRNVRDLDQARTYVLDLIEKHSDKPWQLFIVRLQGEPNPIGVTSFLLRDELDDPDIGYAILPAFRGMGYAYEATAATLAHVLKVPEVQRVVAIVSPDNERSISLLKKLGYRREGEITIGSCSDGCSVLYVPNDA